VVNKNEIHINDDDPEYLICEKRQKGRRAEGFRHDAYAEPLTPTMHPSATLYGPRPEFCPPHPPQLNIRPPRHDREVTVVTYY
jgi:hypothetical protein